MKRRDNVGANRPHLGIGSSLYSNIRGSRDADRNPTHGGLFRDARGCSSGFAFALNLMMEDLR